jgi:quinol monooxygenase YgiN
MEREPAEHAVLTVVGATLDPGRDAAVREAFAELLTKALPDGLLRTELLAGREGRWQIQSLWRDRAALDAMRAGPEPPAAPALFTSLGGVPALEVFEVAAATG